MFKRTLTLIVACLFATSALAGEGVLFNYVLTEEASSSDVITSEFGFLIDFGKEAAADLGGTARLVVSATDEDSYALVSLSLYDYSDNGDLVHIGNRYIDAPFKETSIVKWGRHGEIEYTLSLKPSRHATPPAQDS